jgi:hypothetical protein
MTRTLLKLLMSFGVFLGLQQVAAASDYVVFCAPGLAKDDKETVWLEFQKFVAGGGGKANDPKRGMKPGDTIQVFNASSLRQIGPEVLIPDSARTPALQLKAAADLIDAFKRFLSDETLKSAPVNLPGLVSTYKEKVNSEDAKVLLIGSPLYFDDVEAHDMRQGWLSDGYFAQSPDVTVFSVANKQDSLRGNTIRFCTLLDDDEYGTDNKHAHQDMLKRFWALYIAQCGGKLVSFQQDIVTAFQVLPKDDLEEKKFAVDPEDKEMVVRKSKTNLRDRSSEAALATQEESNTPAAKDQIGSTGAKLSPSSDLDWLFVSDAKSFNQASRDTSSGSNPQWVTRIGLVWPTEGEHADQDLDLYVRPESSTQELSFRKTESPEGRYVKDFPSNSSAKYGFEIVDLTTDESPANLQIWVNAYSGKPQSGFRGEVRVLHKGVLNVYPVKIAATSGNEGGESRNRNRSKFWTAVDAK